MKWPSPGTGHEEGPSIRGPGPGQRSLAVRACECKQVDFLKNWRSLLRCETSTAGGFARARIQVMLFSAAVLGLASRELAASPGRSVPGLIDLLGGAEVSPQPYETRRRSLQGEAAAATLSAVNTNAIRFLVDYTSLDAATAQPFSTCFAIGNWYRRGFPGPEPPADGVPTCVRGPSEWGVPASTGCWGRCVKADLVTANGREIIEYVTSTVAAEVSELLALRTSGAPLTFTVNTNHRPVLTCPRIQNHRSGVRPLRVYASHMHTTTRHWTSGAPLTFTGSELTVHIIELKQSMCSTPHPTPKTARTMESNEYVAVHAFNRPATRRTTTNRSEPSVDMHSPPTTLPAPQTSTGNPATKRTMEDNGYTASAACASDCQTTSFVSAHPQLV